MKSPAIHIFNPENDLALAADVSNYTPPPAPHNLRISGAMLPMWWADPVRDFVIVPQPQLPYASDIARRFSLATPQSPQSPLADLPVDRVCPWGWSAAICHDLKGMGLPESLLPPPSLLSHLRRLSSRLTVIDLHRLLSTSHPLPFPLPPAPVPAFSIDDCKSLLSKSLDYYIKTPWSSTGRGVFRSGAMTYDKILSRCTPKNFPLSFEKPFDKVQDFAMLYESDGSGNVNFVGYSLFDTSPSSPSYSGNILIPSDMIEHRLASMLGDIAPFRATQKAVAESLGEILGNSYAGPVGVDMMIYRDEADGTLRINPHVEINLRRTMGFVAHDWCRRFLAEGVEARLTVTPRQAPDGHENMAIWENGKLIAGRQSLVAPDTKFDIAVSVVSD